MKFLATAVGSTIIGIFNALLALLMFICMIVNFHSFFLIMYLVFGCISAMSFIKASVYASNEKRWEKTSGIVLLMFLFLPIGLFYLNKRIKSNK